MIFKTAHGNLKIPAFFPIIGWPGGRGEYDRLFQNLKYFSQKINHHHFLFNFSSFAFGFTIPRRDFNPIYENFKNKDLRDSLIKLTKIDKYTAHNLKILLDVGGNRIFNKLIYDNKDPSIFRNYDKYLDAYFDFVKYSKVDFFVSFDVGPSYTTRDDISKKGVKTWNSISTEIKNKLNMELLEQSIKKSESTLMIVPIGAASINSFMSHLENIYDQFGKEIKYIGIGGIANRGAHYTSELLHTMRNFILSNNWDVKVHGLGLGGIKNIPLLIKYKIDTCDNATPWRRACTDSMSNMYIPLFDKDYNLTSFSNALQYRNIYDSVWNGIICKCPFCSDLPISELRKIYANSDKNKTNKYRHDDDYYQMRIRIFFHNVFQHIALMKKLDEYKKNRGADFLEYFSNKLPSGKMKRYIAKLI